MVNGDDPGVRKVVRGIRFREGGAETDEGGAPPRSSGTGARAAGPSLVTVGTGSGNRFRIGGIAGEGGRYRFTLEGEGAALDIRLSLPGRFNCVNAALAGVCALRLGVPGGSIERGFASFQGTSVTPTVISALCWRWKLIICS